MCRRFCFFICLILLLSIADNSSAQLLARYKFDETSGNIAVDSSIKGNDGIIEKIDENGAGGDPNWVPGWIDGSLGFDGNLDVNLPAENMGLRSDSGTVALWMKLNDVGSTGTINTIWWAGDTSGSGFGPENETHIHVEIPVGNIWLGGELGFYLRGDPNNVHLHSDPNKGDPAGNEPNSPFLVDDDQWHHIVGTWGNEDGNAKLYIEGKLFHEIPYTYTNISYPFNRMFLGRMGGGNRQYYGYLDDVQIYGRALSIQEIQDVMTGGAALTLQASLPLPANNGKEVPRDAILSWTEGDTAAKHNVYFGTNFDDVNQASLSDPRNVLLSENQDELSFDPPGLMDYDQTYFWRIDEVEADGTIQKGNIWSFTVVNFIVVDNFENYNDTDNIIYDLWGDYFVNNTGMTVGYFVPPSTEQEIVHSGKQSMPLRYDNDGTVNEGTDFETAGTSYYSEATRQWTSGQDWTTDGVESLTIWFRGNAAQVSSFIEEPGGTYTIAASGTDIWGDADEFHFAYKEIPERDAVTIIAKIESLENTDPFAKAGVMIRDTLEPGARNAGVFVTPENGTRYQRRITADDTYETTLFINDANDPNWAPNWVRLERTSSGLVRAFYSENGSDWESFSVQVVSMSFPIYVGLAVTSHNADEVCEAVLSNVTITGTGSDQPWTSQDIGISSNEPEPIYVAVNGNAVIYHEDPNASLIPDWTQWNIDLQEFTNLGVNLTNVSSVGFGIGDRDATEPGGKGSMFIDDIRLYRPSNSNDN
jgi:hypothetical protein